jgi:hypothetical protein
LATRGVAVLLEFGDRLDDSAGVAADDPVDEAGRLVEIIRAGQQIRVLPDRLAGVATGGLLQVAMISPLAASRWNRKS